MTKKVSIVTLTYNQLEKATKPYIESLYQYTDANLFELIIVDNGSNDGTVEYLHEIEKKYDNVKVIYNQENLGYSKGNNQGIKISEGDFIGLLNNDIFLSKEWLEEVLRVFETEPTAGLISPTEVTPYHCPLKKYLENPENYKISGSESYSKTLEASFCCVFFKKELVEKIGLLDENFTPAYFEDNDYSFRSIMANYNNFIANKSVIYHNHYKTSGKINNRFELYERNKKYFFEKHNYLARYCNDMLAKIDYLERKTKPYMPLINFIEMINTRFEKIFRGLMKNTEK